MSAPDVVRTADQLPDDEITVLAWWADGDEWWPAYVETAHDGTPIWRWAGDGREADKPVTHWQHMPASPETGEEER